MLPYPRAHEVAARKLILFGSSRYLLPFERENPLVWCVAWPPRQFIHRFCTVTSVQLCNPFDRILESAFLVYRPHTVSANQPRSIDPFPQPMATFDDLPLEVLPIIVQNIVQPRILASFCLVNKALCVFTQPFLYHTIAVWHRDHEEKVPRCVLSWRASESNSPIAIEARQTFSNTVVFPRTGQIRPETR